MNRSLIKIGQSGFEKQAASHELLTVSILWLVFMKDFKKLLIWQKAMEIIAATYKMADALPDCNKAQAGERGRIEGLFIND